MLPGIRCVLMRSRWSLVGLFLILVLLPSSPVEANLRLCGRRLTRMLFNVCQNQLCGASTFTTAKRSLLPYMDHQDVHSMVKRAGIATQCCMNKCSYAYIKSYCCTDS